MHTLTRMGSCAAAASALAISLGTAAPASAEGVTTVALDSDMRLCDFSLVREAPQEQRTALGSGSALIHTAGSRAIAEVHLSDAPQPGTHFDVGLIQEPRPSSGTCGPGDPGTAFAGMDTDGAGNGTVTIQDAIRPGTTGVWVVIQRPNARSQNPAEFYTSEFVVPV